MNREWSRAAWRLGALCAVAWLPSPMDGAQEVAPGRSGPPAGHPAHAAESTLGKLAAALLAEWIAQSRDEAIAQGVSPIPTEIRSAISGYVPEDVLDRVRWRIGGGWELSLPAGSFYFADTPAITLDHVIVFRDSADALRNIELWIHELRHVIQFRDWGLEGFAVRYLADASEVESEASRYRWDWVFGSSR